MEDLQYTWWYFTVYVPAEDGAEAYEYIDSEQGATLEEAKAAYRENNPDMLILAGGEAEDDDDEPSETYPAVVLPDNFRAGG